MARRPGNSDPIYAGHGIGEWYGSIYRNLTISEQLARRNNINPATGKRFDCPFLASFLPAAPRQGRQPNVTCKKQSGVCSLRAFFTTAEGDWENPPANRPQAPRVRKEIVTSFGGSACTCPTRFVENGTVFIRIVEEVLGVDPCLGAQGFDYVKEVGFLQRVINPHQYPENVIGHIDAEAAIQELEIELEDDEGQFALENNVENVGRIDTILVDRENNSNWCAVELQAVYFSGKSMGRDFAAIGQQTVPLTGANTPREILPPVVRRHPDFRSSGPKRLLPQLQIKVPTLRRWGKKMAVVVDAAFFNSLGPMEHVEHVSNADIVWCVVGYEETRHGPRAPLTVVATVNTTLESAIVGLTAGRPVTKPVFEDRIEEKVAVNRPAPLKNLI